MNISTKTCNRCRKEKPIESFQNNRKIEYNNCQDCRSYLAKNKLDTRKSNPEKDKEYRTQYYESNKERISQKDRIRYLNNRSYMLFNSAKQHSKKSNTPFNITEDYITSIYPKDNICPILNQPFIINSKNQNHYSPTLDKIDPNKGYTINNVQVISMKANQIKSNCSLSELEYILYNFKNYKVYSHPIDESTRATIIQDRLSLLSPSLSYYKNHRILNIESWLLSSAIKRANKKNLQIDIDEDYIKSIWQLDNCCPIRKTKYLYGNLSHCSDSASLDRIDNSLGYIKGNVEVISVKANTIKLNYSIDDLDYVISSFRKYYDRTGTGIIL